MDGAARTVPCGARPSAPAEYLRGVLAPVRAQQPEMSTALSSAPGSDSDAYGLVP